MRETKDVLYEFGCGHYSSFRCSFDWFKESFIITTETIHAANYEPYTLFEVRALIKHHGSIMDIKEEYAITVGQTKSNCLFRIKTIRHSY
jgi:hypothetical protein